MNDLWIPVLGIGLYLYAYSKADKMGRAAIIGMTIGGIIWLCVSLSVHH